MPGSYLFGRQKIVELSRILLERGADVNALDKFGLTPFRLASQSKFARDGRAQVLLQHGADPDRGTGNFFYSCSYVSDSDSDAD
jgi:ankyrin repeat protein